LKKVILLILISLFLLGCTNISVPEKNGANCDFNEDCLIENFIVCEKAYGRINADQNSEIYFQITGEKEEKCEVYIQLNKSSAVPEFFNGLNANCILGFDEFMILRNEMNIDKLNCQGPLYEAALQISALKIVDNNE
jgi:hypothetical protein